MPAESETIAELTARLKTTEEALLKSERLEVASRFAGAVMHEVNNHLEALNNLVYLAKIQPEPAQIITLMETAEEQLQRVGEITRKTLTFIREQAEAREFDLVDIAESALRLHAKRTDQQNIELRKRFKSPAVCKVFAGEILHILSNLILNALDALPAKDAVLCVRVKTCGDNIVVTVSDNGTGIDKTIFEKLYKGHRSTKSQGTGLGLWVSNNFAIKHGGVLACRTSTRSGRSGTTFRLTLPCHLVTKSASQS